MKYRGIEVLKSLQHQEETVKKKTYKVGYSTGQLTWYLK